MSSQGLSTASATTAAVEAGGFPPSEEVGHGVDCSAVDLRYASCNILNCFFPFDLTLNKNQVESELPLSPGNFINFSNIQRTHKRSLFN